MKRRSMEAFGVALASLILFSLVPARAMTDGMVISNRTVPVYDEPHWEALFEEISQRMISVVGQGKVSAVPDMANLRLGVEAEDKEVATAQEIAAQTMNKVMAALGEGGVLKKDIQTRRFSIDPVRVQRVVVGYRVTNIVEAKIRDVEGVGIIIDAAVRAGGDLVRVESIEFSVDDPTPYYREAREKAVKDARERAEQLAHLSGVGLGEPLEISESGGTPVPIYRGSYLLKEATTFAPTTPISPGELEIEIRVNITYAILSSRGS